MSSPTPGSPPAAPSSGPSDQGRSIPFPPGCYSFLPIIDMCDNTTLPTGPWSAADCKRRLRDHPHPTQHTPKAGSTNEQGESALDDDDEEDEQPQPATAADFDREFLVPFFVQLPPDAALATSAGGPSATGPPSRRSSSSRTSFSRLTPLPSLRSSSPTPSPNPLAASSPLAAAATAKPQPIGFLRPSIIRALAADNRKMVLMNCQPAFQFLPPLSLPPPPTASRRQSYSRSRTGSRRGSTAATPLGQTEGSPTPGGGQPASGAAADATSAGGLERALEGLRVDGAPSGEEGTYAVGFADWVNAEGADARGEHIDRVVRGWKQEGMFMDQLGGWRDEHYTIYGPAEPLGAEGASPLPGSNKAFEMERAACALFGVATFGVHATAYTEDDAGNISIWVPRRSATKQTWPNYLDNTVAGGITAGDLPRESIIRECAEEASLPASLVAPLIKSVSVITYTFRTPTGWVQPEVQYIYDLRLAADVVPRPNDGEVAGFERMGVEEVVGRMVAGEFKPNCGVCLVDFFLRHGFLNPESDARFLEVASRLRAGMALPGPA